MGMTAKKKVSTPVTWQRITTVRVSPLISLTFREVAFIPRDEVPCVENNGAVLTAGHYNYVHPVFAVRLPAMPPHGNTPSRMFMSASLSRRNGYSRLDT